jgi:tellurite resistance protein TehA-like permease
MINIDFSSAVAIYLILIFIVVLVVWVFRGRQRDKELSLDPRFMWFCSVCTYTYVSTKAGSISLCPRCGSYNKK